MVRPAARYDGMLAGTPDRTLAAMQALATAIAGARITVLQLLPCGCHPFGQHAVLQQQAGWVENMPAVALLDGHGRRILNAAAKPRLADRRRGRCQPAANEAAAVFACSLPTRGGDAVPGYTGGCRAAVAGGTWIAACLSWIMVAAIHLCDFSPHEQIRYRKRRAGGCRAAAD